MIIEKIQYDFIKDYFEYNAWRQDLSFPILKASSLDIEMLKDFELVEYIYDNKISKVVSSDFEEEILFEVFSPKRKNVFLFTIEHKAKLKSRVRSYKGLINKKDNNKKDFFEFEKDLQNELSIISSVSKLNSENFSYLWSFFFDESTSFIIKSNNNYLNKEFIDKVHLSIRSFSHIQINYLKLVLSFCKGGDIIYRIGGDSGIGFFSIQKFSKVQCPSQNNFRKNSPI